MKLLLRVVRSPLPYLLLAGAVLIGGALHFARSREDPSLPALPPRARLVFLLHDVEGFRHDEVAEMLEISSGASKSQLFRARDLLRRSLVPESEVRA